MAEIRVRLREADGGLPDVCMCCGEPSTILKSKNLSWCPPWVGILILGGLLPYLIVAMIMTKRTTIQAPLCDQHKGHWFNRTLLTVGTFFLFGAIGVGAFILAGILGNNGPGRRNDDSFMGMACALSAVLGLAWLIILIIAQNTAIRPKEITDRDITLAGLSQAFVDAVEEQDLDDRPRRSSRRSRDDDDDYDDRPRKKRSRDEDDDYDDAPRSKRRPAAVDEEDDEPRPRKKRRSSEEFEA
jgi:hypothetical protein